MKQLQMNLNKINLGDFFIKKLRIINVRGVFAELFSCCTRVRRNKDAMKICSWYQKNFTYGHKYPMK